VYSA